LDYLMTATTLAEMRAAAQEAMANAVLETWVDALSTWTPANGSPRQVWAKWRPSRELKRMSIRTEDQEQIDVTLRRDEDHATQPGVERLTLKSTLELPDGRKFTFHGKVTHENPVRRVIIMSRDMPVTMGRR
jgi:hypothetical protein